MSMIVIIIMMMIVLLLLRDGSNVTVVNISLLFIAKVASQEVRPRRVVESLGAAHIN